MKRTLLLLAAAGILLPALRAFSAIATNSWQTVGISEFMATNQSTVLDEDGDPSGWIEIFNPTTNDVSLRGWSLTDDTNNLQMWHFPNVVIPDANDANGSDNYLVVFASGKNRSNSIAELHTNFKLPVNGGYLALVGPQKNIVSVFNSYPPQTTDVAYGRDIVNPSIVGYFPQATPGNPNTLGGVNFSPAVIFSQTGGTFVTPFSLQLSTASNNATIYYTLDGSLPTPSSLAYTNAFLINHSTPVRARAFGAGLMPGPLHSETFLQLDTSLLNTTSSLPAVVIYNFGGGSVPFDNVVGATDQPVNISIYEPQSGLTWLTNMPTLTARAGIHVHGNSTALLPKQAFSVNFCDDLGNDEDYSPLGMPSQSSFVLYAIDNEEPVLIHNPLIYQLSNEIGRYASRTRFVEVYINTNGGAITSSNYNGIYVLEEKVKWDKNRVNIQKIHSVDNLSPQDNSQPNVTGGYIMEIDRPDPGTFGFSAASQTMYYAYPREQELNTPQRTPQQQYLQNYMNSFGAALYATNFTNPTNGYRAFANVPSWIDFHILNVVPFNVDALDLSTYFYKDRTNNLVFGPIWDFDRSQGSTDGRDFSPLKWCVPTTPDFFNYGWWGRLFTDIDFWQAWIDRYEDLRAGVLSTNHIYRAIDALVAQVRAEQPREVARWPSLTTPRSGLIKLSGYSYTFPGTYQGEVDFLKKWYADRLNFVDTNLVAKPIFSNNSGAIEPGSTLTMTAGGGGKVYYTINGSDPRLPGGLISSNALLYGSAIALSSNLTIMARTYNVAHITQTGFDKPRLSSPWSGLESELFTEATPPIITMGPGNLEAYAGQSPVFTVQATGSPAPAYEWLFNNTPLDGQTTPQLTLPLVQTNQTGIYSVSVTNFAGSTNLTFLLTVTPKPNLAVTEAMSSEAKSPKGSSLSTEDWWELSNLGTFPVNLQGYRFDDDHDSFSDAYTITNYVIIAPGESIILVESMSQHDFRTWWGTQNLPANLQIITYPTIGFSSDGDALNLWNAAATDLADKVASVTFPAASKGVSFGYDTTAGIFGALSVAGQNGAFIAAMNGDVGSPGTIPALPPLEQSGSFGTSGFNLSFNTVSNLNYTVEYKDSLMDADWKVLTNFTAPANYFLLNDPATQTNPARFYRVISSP